MNECRESLIDFSRYEIFENGDIKSKQFDRLLTNSNLTKYGYMENTLRNVNGKQHTYARHRVIWYYFKGNIPQGMHIDHINGNKLDNRIENLRCVTPKENMNNPITVEKMKDIYSSEERNQKIREHNMGKPATVEQKMKQSLAMSGKNHPFFGKRRLEHSKIMSEKERDILGRWIKKR